MLFFDVTKTSQQSHHSGLVRVGQRLCDELRTIAPLDVTEVVWNSRNATFFAGDTRRAITPTAADCLFTAELFSEGERPGFSRWLQKRSCRAAALYHDSIPLKYPEITWPQSVARHPFYLKMLSHFDCVVANSVASAAELQGYLGWLDQRKASRIEAVTLGADSHSGERVTSTQGRTASRSLVMIGILEPRKNQMAVMEAAEELWKGGSDFAVTLVGRINPHFGKPIAAHVKALRAAGRAITHLADAGDSEIAALLAGARFAVQPSLAEGCGLPVLEALWAGVGVLASDIPAILESARGGGVTTVPAGDRAALASAMHRLISDDAEIARLTAEACTRPLPTWRDCAKSIFRVAGGAR